MSWTRRLLAVAAAWAAPVAWAAVALSSGPSDGTAISPPGAALGDQRWGDTVTVIRSYADGPLRQGDVVTEVDGRPVGQWVASGPSADRTRGGSVPYEVLRPRAGLAQRLTVQVPLRRYPIAEAAARNAGSLVVLVLPLATASLVFWRRPGVPEARAFLLGSSLLPAVATSWPLGLGVADLAGGRGTWPQLVGEAACALGSGLLLLAVVLFARRGRPLPRWAPAVVLAVPPLGYAAWAAGFAARLDPAAARLHGLITVAGPAVATALPVALAVLVESLLRARTTRDRLAVRLVLLALVGGLGIRVLLVDLPELLTGAPLLPWAALSLLLVPVVLGCLAAALLDYRLEEIEPTVRRTLVQALVATLVGGVFVAVVGAVNLASGTSVESMVAGGAVALLLLPVAIALNRGVRRLVYGDPTAARRVVAELRELDPLTAPTEALRETLALLARRLRLSWASIEVLGDDPEDRIATEIGEPVGPPTSIDLVVAGARLGRLELTAAADRDPFDAADRRLLEDVGAQVGALVQAMTINRSLQRSRQRLVTAREEERLRVRRDLHDGLGPSLATLAMRLEAARDLIADDPAQASDLVGRLAEQAREGIAEVRRLVEGLRPPALDQLGLVSALRQRADEHHLTGGARRAGSPMAWVMEIDDDLGALPAAVEVAAYRIVLEAVTNADRHSGADRCTVTLRREPEALRVRVQDTGSGLAAGRRSGVGLSSMQERARELGGSCAVTSGDGTGTLVEARLPLTAATRADGGG